MLSLMHTLPLKVSSNVKFMDFLNQKLKSFAFCVHSVVPDHIHCPLIESSYLLELFYQAYCYNTEMNHKYTLTIFPRCLGEDAKQPFSPHPLILSSSYSMCFVFACSFSLTLFSSQLNLLLFPIHMNLLPQSLIHGTWL